MNGIVQVFTTIKSTQQASLRSLEGLMMEYLTVCHVQACVFHKKTHHERFRGMRLFQYLVRSVLLQC